MQKLIRRRECAPEATLPSEQLHPLLARIYSARGIATAEELDLGLGSLLPPSLLHNAESAASLLADAIAADSRLLIIGDFDADGATSTALAVSALNSMGARQVDYLVPNRFDYGYGLTPEIVELAATRAPALIITVDNGISSLDGVEIHATTDDGKLVVTIENDAGPMIDTMNSFHEIDGVLSASLIYHHFDEEIAQ